MSGGGTTNDGSKVLPRAFPISFLGDGNRVDFGRGVPADSERPDDGIGASGGGDEET